MVDFPWRTVSLQKGSPGFSLRVAAMFFQAKKEEERRLQEAHRKKLQEAKRGARMTGRLGKSNGVFFNETQKLKKHRLCVFYIDIYNNNQKLDLLD